MSEQQSFRFSSENDASPKSNRRLSVAEINRQFRAMQAMTNGPEKDAAAQEILDWILEQ